MAALILVLFLVIWLIADFFIFYHFIRFGVGVLPKILAFVFLLGSFVIFMVVISAFSQVNWEEIFENVSNLFQIK
jgi:hypothetical protein